MVFLESLKAGGAPFQICLQNHFRVGFGAENVTLIFKFFSNRKEIIDFTVINERVTSILANEWLLPASKIDDAESSMTHSDYTVDVDSGAVWSAMCHEIRRTSEKFLTTS